MISVIVLTYNQEQYIAQTLDSILMQQVDEPIEIVIGNDSSFDSTQAICEEYKKRCPYLIRLFNHKHNLGLVQNFIAMLKECRGEYIALCDGDDYWIDSLKLQKQLNLFRSNTSLVLVHTARMMMDAEGTIYTPEACSGSLTDAKDLFFHYPITAATAMFQSAPVLRWMTKYEMFACKYHWKMQDLPLWLYLGTQGKIGYLNDETTMYRVLSNTLSREKTHVKSYIFEASVMSIKNFFFKKMYVKDLMFVLRFCEMEFHARKRMLLNYGWIAREQIWPLIKLLPYYPMIGYRSITRKLRK